jgi:hypothetical protein
LGSQRALMTLPDEIQAFHDALEQLDGVESVESGIRSLDGIRAEDLRLAGPFADLPHAALRRTGGGLKDEAYLQFEIVLSANDAGWRALDFLAWFVRDQARGGEYVQLRPFALPPSGPNGPRRLGAQPTFHLDLFWLDAGEDLAPILARVAEITKTFELTRRLYLGAND